VVKVCDLIGLLDKVAGPALAEAWDNVGLLIGSPELEIGAVLVALDPTLEVLAEARQRGCNVIVTHHPLIFKGLLAIRTDQPEGRILAAALADQLAIIGCHTNLDKVPGGVSDMLAARLGLSNCRLLSAEQVLPEVTNIGFGRCGELPEPMNFSDFVRYARERLALQVVQVAGRPPQEITRVAVCGGSGSDLTPLARATGAQIYITGEVKHSMARWAESVDFCVLDGGHFATEFPMVAGLAQLIRGGFAALGTEVEVFTAESQTGPFRYY